MALSKESILAAEDVTTELIEIKEWGGKVRVSTLNAAQHQAAFSDPSESKYSNMSRMVAACIVDDDGTRMFTPGELQGKSLSAMLTVFKVAQRLNNLGDDPQAEAEKNSETDQDDTSDSDSQS